MATEAQLRALARANPNINVRGRTAAPGGRRSSVVASSMPTPQLGNSNPNSRSPSPVSIVSLNSMQSIRKEGTGNVMSAENKPYRHPQGTYEGESNINLVPHGKGTYFYKNGDIFSGTWHNGIREGYGCMTYTSGERYSGEYHLSLAHGQGKYEFQNGDVYQGGFKQGRMHGEGVYSYKSGDEYQGRFVKGTKCDKEAVFKYKNGDKYTGRFHENVPYGRGRLWLAKSLTPKEVWNGKLIEIDPRPSQQGAYLNFREEDDIPHEYLEMDVESASNSDEDDDDMSSKASTRSVYTASSSIK